MQFLKFAAAARIASRVISGWPEAPASPLHSPEAGVAGWVGTVPVGGFGANKDRKSGNCAEAMAGEPTTRAVAQKSLDITEPIGIVACLLKLRPDSAQPFSQPLGPDMVSDILTAGSGATRPSGRPEIA